MRNESYFKQIIHMLNTVWWHVTSFSLCLRLKDDCLQKTTRPDMGLGVTNFVLMESGIIHSTPMY